jgi:hypothetical protein
MFIADGNTPMIVGGGVAVGMMALLNMLFVMDAAGKFGKFVNMHHSTHKEEEIFEEASEFLVRATS